MRIALDAMGGDFAPENTLQGAKMALKSLDGIKKLYICGEEKIVKNILNSLSINDPRVEIVHAPQKVDMSDPPTEVLRRKKDSSISIAIDLVQAGDCDAVISAGNTGATVAAASVRLGRLEGVERPGIASILPNENGPCHIIDTGANPEARASQIFQYALMGSVYSQHVYQKPNPVVGLMSVGAEDEKGTEITREVFSMLRDSNLNFCGNVEGHDLFERRIDVIACDGFVGNVILKSCEATARIIFKWLREELEQAGPIEKIGAKMAKGAFKKTKERGSYESYGGSPLLGVNGTIIIAHGASSPLAIRNAIRVAGEAVTHRVNPHIEEELSRYAVKI